MAPAAERRTDYSDMCGKLGELFKAVESLEKMMDIKFEAIEEKLDTRLTGLERKMDEQCKTSRESEIKLAHLAALENKVTALYTSVSVLSAQVDELKQRPQKTKADIIDDLLTAIKNGFITLMAGGAVGLVVWLIAKYMLN